MTPKNASEYCSECGADTANPCGCYDTFCECCGGSVVECSCVWEERWCVDRIEGGEAIGPGYYEERCVTHAGTQ